MIKDLVLKSQFVKFKDEWGISSQNEKEEANVFEKFVNYLVLCQDDASAFVGCPEMLDICSIGGGNDAKIDGIGIKINGRLVGDIEEIKQIAEISKKVSVEFFLIQAKERPNFESAEFNTFGIGVQNFFSDSNLPESDKYQVFRRMKDFIYSDTDFIRKLESNPSVSVVYAFCGNPPQDEHTDGIKKIVRQNLEACPDSLSDIRVEIIGTTDLIKLSKEIANDYTVELVVRDIIPLTTYENVKIKKAYSFTCDAKELLKLLSKDDDTIRKSLFTENVRDYLGNKGNVNREIEKTLSEEPEMFLMCNNGITIVCSDFNQIRDKLVSIQNPQIVNGCQTCHSIFEQRKNISLNKVQVLIKVVCTDEFDIANKIVRGTNKQNQVLEEAFETTKPFHQHLEDYFNARHEKVSLYYERRNKQYASNPNINKYQIVNLRVVTQTLVSMFMQLPYLAHRHEAKLLEMYASEDRKIYREGQSFAPYYLSALTWYKFEEAFRGGRIDKKYKPYKAHLYAIFAYSTGVYPMSLDYGVDAVEKYCNNLELILTTDQFYNVLPKVISIFSKCFDHWTTTGNSRFGVKESKDFSELLLTSARNCFVGKQNKETRIRVRKHEEETWLSGEILSIRIRDGYWFAFIRPADFSENIYFDSSNYTGDFQTILPGVKVKYVRKKREGNNGREMYYASIVKLV